MRRRPGAHAFIVAAIVALLLALVLVVPSGAMGQARFTANVTSGPAPLTVQFTDQTFPPDVALLGIEYLWTFGDGMTSDIRSPIHTFTTPGAYSVRLAITNSLPTSPPPVTIPTTGSAGPTPNEATTVIEVGTPVTTLIPTPTVTTLIPTPTVTTTIPTLTLTTVWQGSYPPSLILYQTVKPQSLLVRVEGAATPSAGSTISRVSWNWGDGTVEDYAVPNAHTYAASGTYTIMVTAFQSDGQSTTKLLRVDLNGPTLTPTVVSVTPTTPPAMLTVTATTVALAVTVSTVTPSVTTVPPTVTIATVTPTGTGEGGGDEFPWWLVAIVAVGLLAGGVAVARGMVRRPPTPEEGMPGVTIEARGGMRRPNSAGPPRRREAEVEIEVRGGMRRER